MHKKPTLGDTVQASIDVTGLDTWIEEKIIDIEENPFKGVVIAIEDNSGRIFFGCAELFKQSGGLHQT
jgi:hypothetical protein